jgi:hypothetical protein
LIRPEVDQTNFRWDVNATGSIHITDVAIVKSYVRRTVLTGVVAQ